MKVMIRVKSLVGKFMLWLTRTKEDFGIYNDEEDIKGGLNKVQVGNNHEGLYQHLMKLL